MKRQFKTGDLVQLEDKASFPGVDHRDIGVVVRSEDIYFNLAKCKNMRWYHRGSWSQASRRHYPRTANMWYRGGERFIVLWSGRVVNIFGGHLKSYDA